MSSRGQWNRGVGHPPKVEEVIATLQDCIQVAGSDFNPVSETVQEAPESQVVDAAILPTGAVQLGEQSQQADPFTNPAETLDIDNT